MVDSPRMRRQIFYHEIPTIGADNIFLFDNRQT